MKLNGIVFCALLATIMMLTWETPAYAYLDPGTGSMAFQALMAVVVGGAAALKIYWHRIKHLFGGERPREGGPPAESGEPRA